ncbi:hypothetical protein RIF29_41008 [Crotalaria pallida]|uniref:Uncharacterized protein n=1 Tax=Crotalaria pallida TaxID=3830 RepID=A0AAN9E462_CROPI
MFSIFFLPPSLGGLFDGCIEHEITQQRTNYSFMAIYPFNNNHHFPNNTPCSTSFKSISVKFAATTHT